MIASRRGLAALGAIAAALGGALAFDAGRAGSEDETRLLVPALRDAKIQQLRWVRAGAPDAAVECCWSVLPAHVEADRATVDQALLALTGGRWHRRADASAAGAIHATLKVVTGDRAVLELGLGGRLDGGEQGWVVVGARALLVDAWVLRALDPDPQALRVRAPLADPTGPVALARGGAAIEVDLARGAELRPDALQLAPERVTALAAALAGVEVVRVPTAPVAAAADGLTILTGHRRVTIGGACADAPELTAIAASTGDGCVARAAAVALEAEAARLAGPPVAIADPRPVADARRATRVVLLDGAVLDLAKRPRLVLGGAAPGDADPARVGELLAALGAAGVVIGRPAGAGLGTLRVSVGGVERALDVYAGGVVARAGEPVAIRLAGDRLAALTAAGAAYRDPALWTDEPTAIAAIAIDGVVHARGAVIGEWSATTRPAELEALAATLAAPRSAFGDEPPARATGPLRHVVLTIQGPTGPAVTRALDLERLGARCALRADGRAAWIAAASCAVR